MLDHPYDIGNFVGQQISQCFFQDNLFLVVIKKIDPKEEEQINRVM